MSSLSPDESEDEGVPITDITDELWRRGDLSYKLDSLQKDMRQKIYAADAKIASILSSRQIGKSYTASVMALEQCIQNPGIIVRIVAPTLKQCADIVSDNLAPICLDAPAGFIQRSKSEYRWTVNGTSSLRLGALERAHVDSNRGGNASIVIYEECGFVTGDDFTYGVNSVLGPQLLRSNGREWYISSPSEDPEHPLHVDILAQCELLETLFRYTVYDSPSITPEMIKEAIRRCGGEDTEAFLREYMAQIIRSAQVVVVPGYDDNAHVAQFHWPIHSHPQVTIDFGGTRDKTVALLHYYNFLADRTEIVDERVFEPNTETDTIVAGCFEMERQVPDGHWFSREAGMRVNRVADAPGQVQVDLGARGYQTAMPIKLDWQAGVNGMAVDVKQSKVLIHPRCKFLRLSLKSGSFNKQRNDFARTKALGHMDGLAALMYALRSQSRENPYPQNTFARQDYWVPQASKPPEAEIAAALLDSPMPARFTPKRFGTFRN